TPYRGILTLWGGPWTLTAVSQKVLAMEAGEKVGAQGDLYEAFDLRGLSASAVGGGEARNGEYTGTKALMMAVLDNGIQSFLGSAERQRLEAELWVMTRQRRGPFCFTVVCETLG